MVAALEQEEPVFERGQKPSFFFVQGRRYHNSVVSGLAILILLQFIDDQYFITFFQFTDLLPR
jgi:hypothetical protein